VDIEIAIGAGRIAGAIACFPATMERLELNDDSETP
jgi:hypothetical protein